MALDENDNEIGRVEKVGAGGMQIRLLPNATLSSATVGSKITVQIVEPGNVRNKFQVEVRMREGDVLGVQFLT